MSVWRFLCVAALLLLLRAEDVSSTLNICGQAPLHQRIVGGHDAYPGSWPWQVSLESRGNHFCGGSLITNEWVLSAAHCFASSSTTGLTVSIGQQTLLGPNANAVSRGLKRIIKHLSYNTLTSDNDIALLQLDAPVTFSDYIRPVCLAASDSRMVAGQKTWITGWGTLWPGADTLPNTLQEVDVPIVKTSQCEKIYGKVDIDITSNMLCAGLVGEGGKDSCQGDSGGPMVMLVAKSQNESVWVQPGIVSFGIGCGDKDYPGVYTLVPRYQKWISDVINTEDPGFVTAGASRAVVPSLLFTILLTASLSLLFHLSI